MTPPENRFYSGIVSRLPKVHLSCAVRQKWSQLLSHSGRVCGKIPRVLFLNRSFSSCLHFPESSQRKQYRDKVKSQSLRFCGEGGRTQNIGVRAYVGEHKNTSVPKYIREHWCACIPWRTREHWCAHIHVAPVWQACCWGCRLADMA